MLQRHVVVWTIDTRNFIFATSLNWRDQFTKADLSDESSSFVMTLSVLISSKGINKVHWYVTKFYVIRNVALKWTMTVLSLLLDLFIVIPSYDVFLWVTRHSQREIYACLFNFDKIRTLLCHRRKVLPHSSTEYYSQLPLLYWPPLEDGNNKKQLCGLTGRLKLISLYHNVNVV